MEAEGERQTLLHALALLKPSCCRLNVQQVFRAIVVGQGHAAHQSDKQTRFQVLSFIIMYDGNVKKYLKTCVSRVEPMQQISQEIVSGIFLSTYAKKFLSF